jgi:hypothetical protein
MEMKPLNRAVMVLLGFIADDLVGTEQCCARRNFNASADAGRRGA